MVDLTPEALSQLLDYPTQAPPPGVTPNFNNPHSIAYQVYITAGFCIILMLVFSLIRFMAKTRSSARNINLSDEIVFSMGLVLSIVFIAMTMACVTKGAFGKHSWDIRMGDYTKSQVVLALLVEITLPLSICAVKASVLMLYLHVFGILSWMRIASIAGIVFVVAFHLSLSISFAAMCAPQASSRLDFLAAFISSKCRHTNVLVVFQGAGNVAIDLFLLTLPLPAIWGMQMPLRRKLATSAMFSVGLCACASSIIGLIYRVQFYRADSDTSYLVVPLWATSMAEETAGVIICCMPSTAIVFKSVKGPVASWLSSKFSRLTGSSPSRDCRGRAKTRSQTYSSLGELSSPNIWIDSEADAHSLQQLKPGNTGVIKKMEFAVSRTVQQEYGRQGHV